MWCMAHQRAICLACAMLLFVPFQGGCKASPSDTSSASRDSGVRPLISLYLGGRYLESSFAPDRSFGMDLSFDGRRIGPDAAGQLAIKSAVIESYPAQTPVLGAWKIHERSSIYFKPAAPLKPGDYIIRFPNASADFVVKPRPYNLIRVGSAVRLASVELLPEKFGKPNDLVRVQIHQSEWILSKPSTVKVEQAQGLTWLPVAMTTKSAGEWTAAKPIDIDRELRVTLSGEMIDGAFKGVPSGPAVVTFVPRQHQTSPDRVVYYVEPNLSIALPSGKKK